MPIATDPIVAGSLLFLSALAALAAVGTVIVWRRWRRRWRQWRSHAAVRSAEALWGIARSTPWRGAGRGAHGRPVDLSSLSLAQARWRVWRAVDAAERSVRDAAATGAPVAELPSLCRRLHATAEGVDRLLSMGHGLDPATPAAVAVRRQAGEVLTAAEHIRLAAVAAVTDTTAPQVELLASDAEQELRCVDSAVTTVRPAPWH